MRKVKPNDSLTALGHQSCRAISSTWCERFCVVNQSQSYWKRLFNNAITSLCSKIGDYLCPLLEATPRWAPCFQGAERKDADIFLPSGLPHAHTDQCLQHPIALKHRTITRVWTLSCGDGLHPVSDKLQEEGLCQIHPHPIENAFHIANNHIWRVRSELLCSTSTKHPVAKSKDSRPRGTTLFWFQQYTNFKIM